VIALDANDSPAPADLSPLADPMNSSVSEKVDAIAVIGMSGRFPGARDCAEFWGKLCAGTECLSNFSAEELVDSGIDPAALSHPGFVNAGGVINDIDQFDAGFFELSPREAEILDPQHRVFLECAWEALEMAGYDPEAYPGAIGVFGGAAMGTYLFNLLAHPELMASVGSFQVLLANDKDHLTTRVAYKLNLKGPSVTIQTACSTSLVSVCVAVQHLLDHQCDLALAGGVGIRVPQKTGYLYQEGMINSPDGHCRPFDAAAKGTVGGNGAGVVVLKRLAEAIEDRDSILAVIRGCAINNDGSLKVGYTAPSVEGQAQVIALAQAVAGVAPETIRYIEAHGTATPLGDPVEMAALTKAFRAGTNKKQFCAIGSVKSNIGHLDPAAGVAGLIKTILMLQHKVFVPSLHFKQANPQIDFSSSPFYVNTRTIEWQNGEFPRRAGVSSFGIGGTNAHVVLEEAPAVVPSGISRRDQLLVLSAKTASALERATINLGRFLSQNPSVNLADVAYTTQIGRRAFAHRRFIVCSAKEEAIQALTSQDPGRVTTCVLENANRPLAFLFPGQGAQYVGMGRDLYQAEPVFRASVDHCAELLQADLGVDIRTLLYPSLEGAAGAGESLEETRFAQPALFVVDYALAKLWMQWKMTPQALIGHSIGEYVAACIAGVFSLRDALKLVATRARLMQQMPRGAMLAVGAAEREIRAWADAELDLAAVNGPQISVVSGPIEQINSLRQRLEMRGIFCHRLRTSHAFHSRMMDPVVPSFAEVMATVALKPPQIPYVSNLTGTWIRNEEATDPHYWARHLRETVRFAGGVETLRQNADWLFLEVGPGHTLTGLTQQCLGPSAKTVGIASLGKVGGNQTETRLLAKAVGELWLSGAGIDWKSYYSHETRCRIAMPTYPFERRRYWIDPPGVTPRDGTRRAESGINKGNLADWFYVPHWEISSAPRPPQPEISKGCCLVFDNGSDTALGAITERLKELRQDVIRARPSSEFRSNAPHEFEIDPLRPEHYAKLLSQCSQAGLVPTRVLHLWGCTSVNSRPTGLEDRVRMADTSFYSVLFLAQTLGELKARPPVRLVIAANETAVVNGRDAICPEKATALGPCKVIPQEYPHISCAHVDLVYPCERGTAISVLIDQLVGELWSASSDSVVAYRGTERWIHRLNPARSGPAPHKPDRLRERGSYLISGGLGGIGLALADHLARTTRARIVLLSRTGLPPRDQWHTWLGTHPPNDKTSEVIRHIQQLESHGGEVLVLAGDVADEIQMRKVLDQTFARFGALHGVIHAAGVAGGGIIQVKSRSMADSVLRPKVRGTLVLDKLLEGMHLDFVALCSSLSSWIGGIGQVDYCAANAFLDAYAHTRSNETGALVFSINWDTWQEAGMAVNTAVPRALETARNESLKHGLTCAEGCAAFDRALSLGQSQVVICTKGLGFLEPTSAIGAAVPATSPKRPDPRTPYQYPRPELKNAYLAPRDELETELVQIWQNLLGVTPIGIQDNFFELGGHSLLAIQLIALVKETLQQDLTIRAIFDAPSVEGLAQRLRGTEQSPDLDRMRGLLDIVDQLSEDEVQKLLEDPELRSRLVFPSTSPSSGNAL
jgi:acyl transferase domain-containing protein